MTATRGSSTTLRPGSGNGNPAAAEPVAVRLRRHLGQPLHANVYALTLNTVVTSLLGIGYWVVAARLYSAEHLGAGAAIVSIVLFLSNLAQLNLNGALSRFLPTAGALAGRLVRSAYLASCGAAIVFGVAFLVAAPVVSARLTMPSSDALFSVAFVLSVAAWSVFTLQDSVLTAARAAVWVPVENAAFGVAKVAVLVLLATSTPDYGIFLSWFVPVVIALVPVNLLVFRRLLPRLHEHSEQPCPPAGLPHRSILIRFITLDYVGFLFMQIGTNALPLLVTAVLGVRANAVFYVGWLLGTALELVAYHFGTSLTVESARDPARLAAYARQILHRGLLLFGSGALMLGIGAPLLLGVFGARYADGSTGVLRLFAIAVVPKLLIIVYVAACRVRRTVGRIVLVQGATTALVLTLSLILMPRVGVTGVGVAYLAAQSAVAAAVLPSLRRLLRNPA
jgi:O-antigen/teichoic acid export membrane protein